MTVQIHQRLLISEYLYWVTSFRNSIHDHTLKATQMTMANYYYKQRCKRLKRNNNCFIWSKIFLISVFLWCVPSSSNLFWKFEHKLDTVLPPESPNDHQFRFHHCPLSQNSLRRSRMDTRGLPGVVLWRRLKWQSKFSSFQSSIFDEDPEWIPEVCLG